MRTMIDSNIDAFDFIIEQLRDRYGIEIDKAKRYLSTSGLEKNILRKTQILDVIPLLPSLTFLDVNYLDKRYLIVLGVDLNHANVDNTHFDYFPTNSGIFTILLSEKLLPISQNVDRDAFVNEIMYQHMDEKYAGHDFSDLEKYFLPVSIFGLKKDSLLSDKSVFQIAVNILSDNNQISVLNFQESVLKRYNRLSISKELKIPFELLLNSMLTSKFKFCFLELYRIIERLFPVTYLQEFHTKSKSPIQFSEFVSELENITSWKPKEDEALKKILEKNGTEKNKIIADLTKEKGFGENLSNYIYKLRNSIVHFRMLHDEIEHTFEEWNNLIHSILDLIEEQYINFRDHV